MKVIEAKQAPAAGNPHGVLMQPLHETPHVVVNMITLKAGESLKRHATPVDAFFYVLEGEGVVEIGEERQRVTQDALVPSPARIPHRLLNESAGTFRFLVVKTPRPSEATKVG